VGDICLFIYLPVCPSACISLCLFIYLPVCLSVCLPACLSVRPSVRLSVCLSVCLSLYLSVCLSVHLSVCPSVYLSISLPACPTARPPVCLSGCLPACLSVYVSGESVITNNVGELLTPIGVRGCSENTPVISNININTNNSSLQQISNPIPLTVYHQNIRGKNNEL
jgi:hypothetical protein